jgi:hypothetical protein
MASTNIPATGLDRSTETIAPRNAVPMSRHTSSADITAKAIAQNTSLIRLSRTASSRPMDSRVSPSKADISSSSLRRRSTARPRRPMRALMIAPMAVSRKTGATASWIARVMSKTCASRTTGMEGNLGARSEARQGAAVPRARHAATASGTRLTAMIATMMSERFARTHGRLPKKYPA